MFDRFYEFIRKSVGSGGGAIEVKDEDTVISSSVRKINFKGADINAVETADGEVTVWVPTSEYASHFNTTDGVTLGTINNSAMNIENRWVAHPTTEGNPYYLSDWSSEVLVDQKASTLENFEITTSNKISIMANSSFNIILIDGELTELINEDITINGNGTYNGTSGYTTIYVTNWEPDYDKYKANIRIVVNVKSLITSGFVHMEVTHKNLGDGNFPFVMEYFLDEDISFTSNVGGSFSVDSSYTNYLKYLSGVSYLSTDTFFTVEDISILNSLKNSYKTEFIELDFGELGCNDVILDKTYFGINTEAENIYSTPLNISSHNAVINKNNFFNRIEGDKNYYIRELGWNINSDSYNISGNYLIDTYNSDSDRITEDFRNENFRKFVSDLTDFDSELTILDKEELQLYNDRLVYPTEDFSGFFSNTVDYTGASTNYDMRYFIRKFWHTDVNHSNGIIKFSDTNITETDITDGNVVIEISLNGSDWFSLNLDFLTSPLSNGDGCRINPDVYNFDGSTKQLQFTLGFDSTNSGNDWGIYFKIGFDDVNNDKYVGKVEIEDWV